MTREEAISLLLSATKRKSIAVRTLAHAEADIRAAEFVLLEDQNSQIAHGETLRVPGYAITRASRRGRKMIEQETLLDAWEELPASVKAKFDNRYTGTVHDLELALGEKHLRFVRYGVSKDVLLVKDSLHAKDDTKQEKIVFKDLTSDG